MGRELGREGEHWRRGGFENKGEGGRGHACVGKVCEREKRKK